MRIRTVGRNLLARLPLVDGMFRRVVWSRLHFPEIEMRLLDSLPPDRIDIAIDVGAATGSYAWILNRKARLVIAFEPGQLHFRALARAAAGTRVRAVNAAVGSVCGKVAMYTPGNDSNALHSATLSGDNPVAHHAATHVCEVEQTTLDSYLESYIDAARSVDVLKVDVEGYEQQVFEGAKLLLERQHPLIVCEIESRHNTRYADVFELLRARGYQSYVYRQGSFGPFAGTSIECMQSAESLRTRLEGNYDPSMNLYINNFVFQHPESKIKVFQ